MVQYPLHMSSKERERERERAALRVRVVVLVVLVFGRCSTVGAALEVRPLMMAGGPPLPAHPAGLLALAVAGLVVASMVATLALPDEHLMLNSAKFCVQAN